MDERQLTTREYVTHPATGTRIVEYKMADTGNGKPNQTTLHAMVSKPETLP